MGIGENIGENVGENTGQTGSNITDGVAGLGTLAVDGPATPQQMALILPVTGTPDNDATAACRYKKTADSGWTTGHPLYRIQPSYSTSPAVGGSLNDDFAWTIIDLDEGTSYDVEVTVDDGVGQEIKTLTASTRVLPAAASTPTITVSTVSAIVSAFAVVSAGDVLEIDNGDYTVSGLTLDRAGSSGDLIYIRGESRASCIITDTTGDIFTLQDTGYVVIENMTLIGSEADSCANSRAFYQSDQNYDNEEITIRNLTITGVDRAVYFAAETYSCLIYDCTITGNNLWSTSPTNFLESNTWNDDGIHLPGEGNCGFNITITGFGDTFSYSTHSGGDTTTESFSIHFYRNDVRNSCDDPVEADHASRNCTWHDNRITNSINADSIDPLYGGPWISARNICINPYRTRTQKWNATNSGHFLYNNTILSTLRNDSAAGGDISLWYQPNNGAQRSYGYRNNIDVYHGTGQSIWLDNATHNPIDFCNNAWFPDDLIDWPDAVFDSLASAQAAMPSTTAVFAGKQRMEDDVITTSSPWTETITIGASSRAEVSGSYLPILASSDAKNAGMVIPNITDGYLGAAPDIGALIDGRGVPLYGDRTIMPSWYPSTSGVVVEIDSGTTVAGAANAGGAGSFPGTDDANLCAPWAGGALVYIAQQPYLVVLGGGHNDGAWNGQVKFGPLYGPGSDDPKWSLFLASSDVGDVTSNSELYSDGRQSACHTYSDPIGVGDTLYMMSTTATYGGSAPQFDGVYSFTPAGQTTLAENPQAQWAGSTAYYDGKIYYHGGDNNFDDLGACTISTDSWTQDDQSQLAFGDAAAAADTERGGLLITDGSNTCYWDLSDLSRLTSRNDPSNFDKALLYDPDRDAFISYQDGSLTVRELDAASLAASGNPSWTTRTFTGDTPAASVAAGTFGRFRYVPELKGYIVVPNSSSDVYFFRSQ